MKQQENQSIQSLLVRGYRYALTLCGSPAQAQDLVQEASLRVLQKGLPMNIGVLFRVIRNHFIDEVRKAKVRQKWAEQQPTTHQHDHIKIADPGLEKALQQLAPDTRELLYLFVVEEYTAKELAELTGKPRGTILSAVHRAKQKLRKMLAESDQITQEYG
ncbi:MAG: RNA polymerase sigma factor [Bacteroidota bacterium]